MAHSACMEVSMRPYALGVDLPAIQEICANVYGGTDYMPRCVLSGGCAAQLASSVRHPGSSMRAPTCALVTNVRCAAFTNHAPPTPWRQCREVEHLGARPDTLVLVAEVAGRLEAVGARPGRRIGLWLGHTTCRGGRVHAG